VESWYQNRDPISGEIRDFEKQKTLPPGLIAQPSKSMNSLYQGRGIYRPEIRYFNAGRREVDHTIELFRHPT